MDDNIFEKYLFEAPADESEPPTVDDSPAQEDSDPPQLDDDGTGDFGGGDESEPDMSMDDSGSDFSDDNNEDNGDPQENETKNMKLDAKVSAIMNMNLYQRFLSLLNNIGNELTMIKANSDILYTVSNESIDIIDKLKKLDDNIRIYLKNYFLNEDYSRNLLFFNKCLNMLKILNDIFDKNVHKGMRDVD